MKKITWKTVNVTVNGLDKLRDELKLSDKTLQKLMKEVADQMLADIEKQTYEALVFPAPIVLGAIDVIAKEVPTKLLPDKPQQGGEKK